MTLSDLAASPPTPRTHEVLADGVTLFVRDWGPVDAPAVIHHHGLPSCSLSVPGGWSAPDETGVRVVTFDRPGYGHSPVRPGRRVTDAAGWTRAIADSLGLSSFALSGTGAGGPHAVAAAAVLGERVPKLCIANGLGPDELPGFDPASGMLRETRHEIACARAGEGPLREFIETLMTRMEPMDPWFRQLPASDVELMGRRDVQVEDAAVYAESMRSGQDGWVDDDLALFRHRWGTDPGAVTAQTLVLYGVDDVLLPASHGDAWVTALGHGQLVKLPEVGHWLRDYEPDVLRWLADPGDAPARLSL